MIKQKKAAAKFRKSDSCSNLFHLELSLVLSIYVMRAMHVLLLDEPDNGCAQGAVGPNFIVTV